MSRGNVFTWKENGCIGWPAAGGRCRYGTVEGVEDAAGPLRLSGARDRHGLLRGNISPSSACSIGGVRLTLSIIDCPLSWKRLIKKVLHNIRRNSFCLGVFEAASNRLCSQFNNTPGSSKRYTKALEPYLDKDD